MLRNWPNNVIKLTRWFHADIRQKNKMNIERTASKTKNGLPKVVRQKCIFMDSSTLLKEIGCKEEYKHFWVNWYWNKKEAGNLNHLHKPKIAAVLRISSICHSQTTTDGILWRQHAFDMNGIEDGINLKLHWKPHRSTNRYIRAKVILRINHLLNCWILHHFLQSFHGQNRTCFS